MGSKWYRVASFTVTASTTFPPAATAGTLAATADAVSCSVGINNITPSGTFLATFSAQRIADDVWIPLVAYQFGTSSKAPDVYGTGQRECPMVEIPPGVYDNVGITIIGSFAGVPEQFICEIQARIS
jgi:hypothetical protein